MAEPSSFSRLSCGADRIGVAASGAAAIAATPKLLWRGHKLAEHREAIRATIAAMKTAAKKKSSLAIGVLALMVACVSALVFSSAAIASSVDVVGQKTRAEVFGPFTAESTERSERNPVNSSRIYDALGGVALECLVAPVSEVPVGTRLTRNWGGNSGPNGQSWTRDPVSQQTRESLGLGRSNTGEFVSHGELIDNTGVTSRRALPWDGFKGGGDEVLCPDPATQIRLRAVTMPERPLPDR
jgi:hypothetical protein